MKEEILAAVMFFIRFIEKSDKFPQDQIENFKKHLTELLMERQYALKNGDLIIPREPETTVHWALPPAKLYNCACRIWILYHDAQMRRFEKHWFPELPTRGQAYRCIRINGISPIDLTLERAASKCGSSYHHLRLPTELTVWVDPSEVCYRLGESEGSYCTLATFPSESRSSSSENSTPTTSPPSTPLQDKYRKVQRPLHQRYSTDYTNKYRNPNMFLSSLRMKSTNEGNFNFGANRQICRGPFPANPTFYKNMNINRAHYKNVCRV